jgi:tripartite-type tricarboxylate transporter receptor subunit TctC
VRGLSRLAAGLFAPAGTSEPVVSRLRAEIYKALANPGFARKLTKVGPEPLVLSAQEFNALIRCDFERYGKVVKKIGLKIQ